jgi:adenine-specific DNA-methyltransferase
MIYIDPPYNTGKDFIYEDDFAEETGEFLRRDGQYDEQGNRLTPNLDSNGRFHTDWLNMIYPRLRIARDLLTDDGVIFVSCDDNEQENFKKILNEIFGERNSLGLFIINSTPNARDYGHIGKMHEFVLFYAKNFIATETNLLPELDKTFKYNDERGGFNVHPLYNSNEAFTKLNRPNLYYPFYIYLDKPIDKDFFAIGLEKKEGAIEIYPPKSVKNGVQFVWRWGKEKALKNLNVEIIGYKTGDGEYRIVQKMRHSEKIIRSILSDTSYSSRRGTAEVEEILEGKIFDFPKPISLLKDLVKVGAKEDSIILDFFSGSATTAHAVMQLNAEDGGKRKFIMVQLPEPCDENSDAYKTGYKTIAEIGKERIRRAGKKIKEDNKDKPGIENLDIGFRVLKLDSSNMKDVYYTPEEYAQMNFNLEGFMDNIKPDRTEEDLLFQVMLDLGIPLSAKIRQEGETFYVNDNYLIACFGRVDTALITEIAKKKPYYAVFRDSSFINDSAMVNFEQVFSTYSPNTIRRVL